MRFALTLNLRTEKFHEDELDKRFEIGRQLYNAVLGKALKRYKEMIKTKAYRDAQTNIFELHKNHKGTQSEIYKDCKHSYSIKNEMLRTYKLSEYSLYNDVKYMQQRFKDSIDSLTARKIASSVWQSINNCLFAKGKGNNMQFKPKNRPLKSLEGKDNTKGMRYKIGTSAFHWLGLEIPVEVDKSNPYEVDALRNKICYCRITRSFVRGKYRYKLQLILEGIPPTKTDKGGILRHKMGYGRCGIDIGTQTIAYVNDNDAKLYELAPNVQNIEKEKKRIQRYLDRSRRVNNLDNFNANGTIKKGVKLKWKNSNRYTKAQGILKDLYRKQADIRRQDHNKLANEIVNGCNIAYVETMNFKGLQARTKKTEKNEKGKFKRKKRFGKSIANKAPSMFLTILGSKLENKGGQLLKVDTKEVKASQYNHLNHEYKKKKLSQRWNDLGGIRVQRDLYSAFLLKNVNSDLKSINNELCNTTFDDFIVLHDEEVERLADKKLGIALNNVL